METSLKLPGKFSRRCGYQGVTAISVQGQSNNQGVGTPVVD